MLDLETRITPAFNLLIDGDTITAGVTTTISGGVTNFTASAIGATLDVADIVAALQIGDVVIDTNNTGAEAGNILWDRTSAADDLLANGILASRLLRFRTVDSAGTGNVTFTNNVVLNGGANVNFRFQTDRAGTDGAVNLGGATVIGHDLDIFAGTAAVTYQNVSLGGGAGLSGGSIISTGDSSFETSGTATLSFNAPLTVSAVGTAIRSLNNGAIAFSDTVSGTGNLTLEAGGVFFTGGNVNLTGASTLQFDAGTVTFGSNSITAPNIGVGNLFNSAGARFGNGTGIVTGDVTVNANGNLTPGGVGVGTLNIVGNVTIDAGGAYDPDLAALGSDLLAITGDLTVDANSLLGKAGTGAITAAANIVTTSGTITGMFLNTPPATPAIVGQDVVTVTYVGGPSGTIAITPFTPTNTKMASGHDDDGTGYIAKLTGLGTLTAVPSATGRPSFVLKGTTSASTLTITTKANGSDKILRADRLLVSSALNMVNAATTDFIGRVKLDQTVKSLTARDVFGNTTIGGVIGNNTTVKTRTLGKLTSGSTLAMLSVGGFLFDDITAPKIGNVTVSGVFQGNLNSAGSIGAIKLGSADFGGTITAAGGSITSVTVAGDMSASVRATAVGAVKVGGILSDFFGGTGWNVVGSITSITAGAIGLAFNGFTLSARNLGTLFVKGNPAAGVPADIGKSTFTLSGNNLPGSPDNRPDGFGIGTVTVAGNVQDSTFRLQEGSLLSFKAARFINSNLYLNYTPGMGQFDATGTFQSAAQFKVGSFTTTATTLGTSANPLNFAFTGSQIVADTIGTVKLSGVGSNFSGTHFGVKFHTAGGSVKVASGLPAILLNTNLTPAVTPIQDDFYFIGV